MWQFLGWTVLKYSSLQQATSGPLKVLGDSLRNDPKSLYLNEEHALANLETGKYALIVVLETNRHNNTLK